MKTKLVSLYFLVKLLGHLENAEFKQKSNGTHCTLARSYKYVYRWKTSADSLFNVWQD